MEYTPERIDVLVVGAGPSGLTTALLLAARGLRVLVAERRHSTSDEPKAISLDDEAIRVFQQAGIADTVLSIIVPGTGTRYFDSDGAAVFHARAAVPYRFGFPFKNPFAQPDLERVLASSLEAMPTASLRFDEELVGLQERCSDVLATIRDADGVEREVEAAYVVGADGGRSTVRRLAGIEMSGESFDTPWLVVDALGDTHRERFGMHHGEPRRPHVIVPGLDGRCRYEFLLFPGEGVAGEAVPFELIERVLAPHRAIRPDEVERAVVYTFNALVADRWRQGRMLLVGDAAHMMPPFAGQGLNSGIRDAANLAWKLAAVIDGTAHPDILDSYGAERRPHAEATVRLSARLGRVVMTTSERLAGFRDRVVRRALESPEGREFFEFMRYRPSAQLRAGLVWPGSTPQLVGAPIGQPRVFDDRTRRLVGLDDILGTGWAVIGVEVSAADWDAAGTVAEALGAARAHTDLDETYPRDVRRARVVFDVDGRLDAEVAPYRGRFMLVRPDRVIAAAWAAPETDGLLEALRGSPLHSDAARPSAASPRPQRKG